MVTNLLRTLRMSFTPVRIDLAQIDAQVTSEDDESSNPPEEVPVGEEGETQQEETEEERGKRIAAQWTTNVRNGSPPTKHGLELLGSSLRI